MDREKVIKESEEAIDILAKAEEPTFLLDFVRCAFENALALLKGQEAVTKWKDASYELPDQEGDYLVFIPGEYHDTMMVARYSFNCKIPWRGAQAHSAIEDVLLWMPLPKVPKEGR